MACPAEDFYATPGLGKDEIRLAYILKEGLEKYLEVKKLNKISDQLSDIDT